MVDKNESASILIRGFPFAISIDTSSSAGKFLRVWQEQHVCHECWGMHTVSCILLAVQKEAHRLLFYFLIGFAAVK